MKTLSNVDQTCLLDSGGSKLGLKSIYDFRPNLFDIRAFVD